MDNWEEIVSGLPGSVLPKEFPINPCYLGPLYRVVTSCQDGFSGRQPPHESVVVLGPSAAGTSGTLHLRCHLRHVNQAKIKNALVSAMLLDIIS